MIIRMWEAHVRPERMDEMCAFIIERILPRMSAAGGYLGSDIYRPFDGDDRVVQLSRWRDEEALRALAGPNWRFRPLFAEEESPWTIRAPRVSHFLLAASG